MLVEELAKKLAKNFDNESNKKYFSIKKKEAVLDTLKNTLLYVFRDLSGWLVDKYTIIDLETNEDGNVELGVYVDYENLTKELVLEIQLFMDTLNQYSNKIDQVKNNDQDMT